MAGGLCLLSVHAHPDDESSKGASTVARYHAEGVRTVLVTCTGGEEGDILNPALDSEEVRANLGAVRRAELERAVEIIGYDELYWLGYRDSGMPDKPTNFHPGCFAVAPLDEAVERLVRIIRRERPQVILSYGPEQRGYRHPDHLRVHEITDIAFEKSGDPEAFPDAGEPYTPLKLYYGSFMRRRFVERHAKFLELGLDSPYTERVEQFLKEGGQEPDETTTRIDVSGFGHVRLDALRAHATQIDPASPHWFGLPEEIEHELLARLDPYVLAQSHVGPISEEDDLFAGVRELASSTQAHSS